MGSWVTRAMGFPPANFQFATPFRSRFRVIYGKGRRTGWQTDRPRPSMHNASALWGRA